jgi:hypothetical protein
MDNSSGQNCNCIEVRNVDDRPSWWHKLTATQQAEHKNFEEMQRHYLFGGEIFISSKPDLIEGVKSVNHKPFPKETNTDQPYWRSLENHND